jgi:phospholipid/cholesterol/gamma-HCH transport system substrate-binding protein
MALPSRHRYEIYGVALLAFVVGLVGLTLAMFKQVFTPTVPVSVHISRAGLQLLPGSDVKLRGIIVGDVKGITSNGTGAELDLRIKPAMARRIPANVSVRLVPKTIFGEKYVDLVTPRRPEGHLVSGDVIPEDRSRPALEINQALDDLLPILRTVRPDQLNMTLTALATALDGRGNQLGKTLVQLRNYVRTLQPHVPALGQDLALGGRVAHDYAQSAPALLHLLRNLAATSDTVVSQQQALVSLLHEVAGTAATTRALLSNSRHDIIAVNRLSRGTVSLLARYSPEYPCLIRGIYDVIDRIHGAQPSHGPLRFGPLVTLEFLPPKSAYKYPTDTPEFADKRGPNCYGLPHPPNSLPVVHYKDGTGPGNGSVAGPSSSGVRRTHAQQPGSTLLRRLLSRHPAHVPDIAELLFGPLLRGLSVTLP